MKDFIVRGIMLGGSIGVFGALLGYSDSMGRAFFLGMFGGAFAGYTLYKIREKKGKL